MMDQAAQFLSGCTGAPFNSDQAVFQATMVPIWQGRFLKHLFLQANSLRNQDVVVVTLNYRTNGEPIFPAYPSRELIV
jgi:hypothetical protein